MTVTHPLPQGTLCRVTEVPDASWSGRPGETFTVEDYVSEEQSETEPKVAFYWGSNNGGMNNVTVPAASVEVVKTAQAMAARKVPTPEEVAAEFNVHTHHDLFEVNESSAEGDEITMYGETEDGLNIEVILKVVSVRETDW